MFGEEAKLPLDLMFGPTPSDQELCPHEYVQWLEEALTDIYNEANKKMAGKIKYMKQHYDLKAYGNPHEIGDLIWILKGIYEHKKVPKLRKPYKGPYKIVKKLSNISYEAKNLTSPYETCLVHFNRTKKCHLSKLALDKYIRSEMQQNDEICDTQELPEEQAEPIVTITDTLPPPPPLMMGRPPSPPPIHNEPLEDTTDLRVTRSGQVYGHH